MRISWWSFLPSFMQAFTSCCSGERCSSWSWQLLVTWQLLINFDNSIKLVIEDQKVNNKSITWWKIMIVGKLPNPSGQWPPCNYSTFFIELNFRSSQHRDVVEKLRLEHGSSRWIIQSIIRKYFRTNYGLGCFFNPPPKSSKCQLVSKFWHL